MISSRLYKRLKPHEQAQWRPEQIVAVRPEHLEVVDPTHRYPQATKVVRRVAVPQETRGTVTCPAVLQ